MGDHLVKLQRSLLDESWQPQGYRSFAINEPKRRWISAAPFSDRIVHHALVRATAGAFERTFCETSFANRKGFGLHRAVDAFSAMAASHRYVLRLDVKRYFESINHEILRGILYCRIRDQRLQRVVDAIIRSWQGGDTHGVASSTETDSTHFKTSRIVDCGLPLGNLTSQMWANCYLDSLDQFVLRTIRPAGYLRYVDDFALFSDDREVLSAAGDRIANFLADKLRLSLHDHSGQVHDVANGTPWLGCVIYPTHRRLKARKIVEVRRRLRKQYAALTRKEIELAEFDRSIQSTLAHARIAASWRSMSGILQELDVTACFATR